jgi:hypothetical protein
MGMTNSVLIKVQWSNYATIAIAPDDSVMATDIILLKLVLILIIADSVILSAEMKINKLFMLIDQSKVYYYR